MLAKRYISQGIQNPIDEQLITRHPKELERLKGITGQDLFSQKRREVIQIIGRSGKEIFIVWLFREQQALAIIGYGLDNITLTGRDRKSQVLRPLEAELDFGFLAPQSTAQSGLLTTNPNDRPIEWRIQIGTEEPGMRVRY